MNRTLFLLWFLLTTSCNNFAQNKDSIKQAEISRMLLSWKYACGANYFGFTTDYYGFVNDSGLKEFYTGIDRTGHFKITGEDTCLYLQNLLNKAMNNSETCCFLPFLKLYDKTAEDVHKYSCFMSSYKVPHKVYCGEPPVQFTVLFVIQHSIVAPYKLYQSQRFEDIKLSKNGAEFGRPDYDTVYKLYQNYIVNRYQKKQLDTPLPLSGTPYNWVVTTSNKLTKQELKQLERWRNPKY